MKNRWLVASVVMLALLAACRPVASDLGRAADPTASLDLLFLSMNDNWGYVTPCG